MKFIKVIKTFFKGFKFQFLFLFFLGIITSFISFVNPIMSANIITGISEENVKKVIILSVCIFLLSLSFRLIDFVSNALFSKVKLKCILNIRMKLCERVLDIKMHEFDEKSSGVFLERIKNDPNDIVTVFNDVQDYLLEMITNVGIIFYVYFINFYIGLFYSIAITALFIIQKTRILVQLQRTKEWKVIAEENTSTLNEFMRGIRDIKTLGLDKTFLGYIEKTFTMNHNKRYEMNYQNYWYTFFYHMTRLFISSTILIGGAILLFQGKITAASLLVVYMYRNNIFSFVINTSKFMEAVGKFNVSADRIFALLESDQFENDNYGTKNVKSLKGNILFQHVHFAYDKKKVLKDVSFEIQDKEVVAIVGKSGGGKSTLFNLITKLYEVPNNTIFIDGNDLNTLSKKTLRNNIVFITQNPYIFKMSVKDNLRLVNPKLKDEEMIRVCKSVCIHDYIMELPNGYDTILGEAGSTMSGGQKQRLAIARALIKNANIILLDEATSALDNETQESIKKTIKNISKSCTVVMIAHRLSTINNADKIIVIDKGKVVSIGTHRQLIRSCEIYKNLYKGTE